MSCWQGHTGPILSTASEERTQKREVTREERRRYSAGGHEESLTQQALFFCISKYDVSTVAVFDNNKFVPVLSPFLEIRHKGWHSTTSIYSLSFSLCTWAVPSVLLLLASHSAAPDAEV